MKDLVAAIFNIFKYTGKIFSLIRNFLFNMVLIIIAGIFIFSFFPKTQLTIPENSFVRLDITGDIVEQKKIISSLEKLFDNPMDFNDSDPETTLQDILDVIDNAADDTRITGILLNLKNMKRAGLDQLLTIGQSIENFKGSGKKVIASEDFYSQSQYLLASYADKIILNPMGAVDIHGFGIYKLYFKDAIDKLKINYNIFKVGSHKSALEPFTRNNMSKEDRQQNELWLASLWSEYIETVSQQRNLPIELISSYPDSIAKNLKETQGDAAKLALKSGLVDQIWTREETNNYLNIQLKKQNHQESFISSNKYLETIIPSYKNDAADAKTIGVIIAEGTILPGNQPNGFIGGESLRKLIQKARKDNDIKALVLRINSGGGSAFASEIIRQELLEMKKGGKPLVVSMGTMAASGGYWIAADADEIWSSKVTITGSIGIFGAIPTFNKSLEKLGIYSDGTGTTSLAAGLDLTQPLPEQLKSAIQQNVTHNYDNFIKLVARGRNLPKDRVEKLAQGRVYDGKAAKNLGLVDNLGSLQDAVKAAARLAKLEDYSANYIQAPVSVKSQLWQLLSSTYSFFLPDSSLDNLVHTPLLTLENELMSHIKTYALLNDPKHTFVFCPIKLSF